MYAWEQWEKYSAENRVLTYYLVVVVVVSLHDIVIVVLLEYF